MDWRGGIKATSNIQHRTSNVEVRADKNVCPTRSFGEEADGVIDAGGGGCFFALDVVEDEAEDQGLVVGGGEVAGEGSDGADAASLAAHFSGEVAEAGAEGAGLGGL